MTTTTTTPTRATWKGHGNPATLLHFGSGATPTAEGNPVGVRTSGSGLEFVDATGKAVGWSGVASKFWAAPVPAEADAAVAPARWADVRRAARSVRATDAPAPAGEELPEAVVTVNLEYPDIRHARCPECGKVVAVRADGRSLFTHNRAPRQQCPLSRRRVKLVERNAGPAPAEAVEQPAAPAPAAPVARGAQVDLESIAAACEVAAELPERARPGGTPSRFAAGYQAALGDVQTALASGGEEAVRAWLRDNLHGAN